MSTASIFSAAALRKMAPTLVESTMPSSTATRRALRQTSSTLRGSGRRNAHSTPRVSSKPVRLASVSRSAVYTGASPQRVRISAAGPVICRRSMSRERGVYPASSARAITLGLSAMKIPFSGSRRLRSCACVRRA